MAIDLPCTGHGPHGVGDPSTVVAEVDVATGLRTAIAAVEQQCAATIDIDRPRAKRAARAAVANLKRAGINVGLIVRVGPGQCRHAGTLLLNLTAVVDSIGYDQSVIRTVEDDTCTVLYPDSAGPHGSAGPAIAQEETHVRASQSRGSRIGVGAEEIDMAIIEGAVEEDPPAGSIQIAVENEIPVVSPVRALDSQFIVIEVKVAIEGEGSVVEPNVVDPLACDHRPIARERDVVRTAQAGIAGIDHKLVGEYKPRHGSLQLRPI